VCALGQVDVPMEELKHEEPGEIYCGRQ
jgi:hypothetical protein